jgi:hypothetical protein
MRIRSALFFLLTMIIISCGSDDDSDDDEKPYTCSSCVDSPEALPANDTSGKGIYKGVVIGSSGTLKIDMDNDGSGISAILVLDGEQIELETESIYSSEGGFDGYFYNDNGTETNTDDYEIGFYINETGSSLEVYGISFPSPHDDVTIELIKETSYALIRVFEGTFSGDGGGIWNMMMVDDEDNELWYAVSRPSDGDSDDEDYFMGITQGSELSGGGGNNIEVAGTIDGDNIKGTWETYQGNSGNWKGKRTL